MKAVTVGGAMVDAIAVIDDDNIKRLSREDADGAYLLVESGRKIEAREISQHCGGGGVNAAVAMARLGLDVATVLKLGRDGRAETILRRLADEGVSTRWVMRDADAATGSSVMISAHDRDAAIFTFRGANARLTPGDLTGDMLAADLVYIAGLSNEAADCFGPLVDGASTAGARIAANPGIRQLTRRGGPFFESVGAIDILSMNRAEAAALTPTLAERFGEGGPPLGAQDSADPPELARMGLAFGGFEMALAKYVSALHSLGVGHILITDGKHGAFASDGAVLRHRPAEPATVAGTAGAGDAFAATFSAWLAETDDAAAALDAAAVNAASVVRHVDTQTGLLSRPALDERLAARSAAGAAQTAWTL